MSGTRKPRRPTFLWQALLILLPVIALTAVSFWVLRQDRAAVEREARDRAGELVKGLARELVTRAGVRVAWAQLRATHEQKWLSAVSQWRLAQDAKLLFPMTEDGPAVMEDSGGTQMISPKEGPLPDLVFGSDGELAEPGARFLHPQPPRWLVELNGEQRLAWDELPSRLINRADSGEVENVVARFQKTSPPPHAQAAAEFLRLRTTLADAPPASALTQWVHFAETCGGVLPIAGAYQPATNAWRGAASEAGLPLSTLATLESVRVRTSRRFSPEQWQGVVREVWLYPSLMTSPLLDCVDARAEGNDPYRTYVQRMREHFEHMKEKWALAQLIQRSGQFGSNATNSFWIGEPGEAHWLSVLLPGSKSFGSAATVGSSSDGGSSVHAFLYSKDAVVNAFSNALQSIKGIKPVPYLTLSIELEGESIPVPQPWGASLNPTSPTACFASAEGRLSSPAYTRDALRRGPGFGLGFEALPAQPRFKLALRLVDPGLMYAAQRRRAVLSMSLVATAAAAALFGLMVAWRSFHRQLALNDLKSNFVSSVSHELRAPIASVRLLAESLERGKISEPAKQNEYFRFIVQECRRLSSLIENVLDFSRIEQGRKQYEFEPTNVTALVEQTVKLLEPYAAERGVQLKSKIQNPKSEMEVDGRAIQQALVNLIDNAIKHSPKGEPVLVELLDATRNTEHAARIEDEGREQERGGAGTPRITHHASRITLSVTDHGPGIPASERERIFERFHRLGSELRRETQGVGIGLSIVKHIVAAHGGRVRVESKVGKGSRFTIELPEINAKAQRREDAKNT